MRSRSPEVLRFAKLISAIGLSLTAGFIGSLFTAPAIPGWYAELVKPLLTPPGWVFVPVWTVLYVLMGIAAWLVWQKGLKQEKVRVALVAFVAQLIANAWWSVVFFGWQNITCALIMIGALWLLIVLTIYAFGQVSRLAGWLLVPYVLWVSFATYLNYMIWMLN